jgi:hypothetical protein
MTFQARNDVRVAVLAQFDHDPAAAHLVRNRASGSRTSKGVEHQVAGVARQRDDLRNQLFRLGCWEVTDIEGSQFSNAILVVSKLCHQPRAWWA